MVDKMKSQEQITAPEMGKTDPVDTAKPAPEMDQTAETGEPMDEEDISDIIGILNLIDKDYAGGKGEISTIPPELKGVVKTLITKLLALKNSYKDPYWVAINDDLVEQGEEGVENPSVLVAIARNVPLDELESIADNENYGDIQKSVSDKLNKESEDGKAEEELYGKFDKSKAEFEAYCQENSLSDEAKSALWQKVVMLMKIFGDGYISKTEYAEVDKMNNYDNDIAGLKNQMPKQPKKEVLPDKASIGEAMNPVPVTKPQPRNSIENMAAYSGGTDVTEIGKRKRRATM